jgi:alpha/beta superfamily hydrolase
MDNLILEKVNENLLKNGIATLRFNFRGVGNSTGEFTGGKSEGTDIISIVEFLSTHTLIDGSRIGIFGYSFGAWMALEATLATSKIKSVVSVACPQRSYSTFGTVEMVQPKLLISGDRDHDFPHGQFKFLSGRFTEPRQVETITGADHFFHGYEDILGELTVNFFLGTI